MFKNKDDIRKNVFIFFFFKLSVDNMWNVDYRGATAPKKMVGVLAYSYNIWKPYFLIYFNV